MEDELNTLASKPSIPPINDGDQKKQGDTFTKIEKIKSSSKSSVINHEKKDIKEELKNSPQKPSASAAKEEERDISPESPNEKIKKTSEKEEQKEAPSSKGRPDIASPSPKMVQREIDHEIKPDLSVTTQPVVDVKDHKLDLPLVHKKASQEADDKSLTEKPMSEKVTGKFAEKEPEKDLSLKKKSKQFGKESPKITQEKPEFQAKKSAREVIKQSRPKKTIIFSPSQNIEKPKSKYILPLIKKFDKKSGFDELITPTAKNVIQRQPENKVDKFPEKDDFTQSGDSLDEKFRPVVQTLQTSKQTKKPEQKKLIVKKTDGLETPRRHLTIQQTPLSRKITQKFLDKKNINPSPIKIQTVRKDSFPIIMRSVGKVNDKPTEDFSIEETYDNRIVPGKKKPDYTSKPQQGNKKTINAESIADKLLVTQLGRKTIQKSLPKNNAIDVSQANEPILEQKYSTSKASLFNQNSQPTGFLKQKKLSGFQQGSNEEKTVKKFPKNRSVSETKYVTQKFEKKLTPLKEELPVVQMKKTISSEPTFHPELAVQGPVVQRIIEPELESIQPVDDPNVVKLDLSKLARDVYPIIKRWMAVEKERTSGRL
jgi:hypothetical protein